MLIDNIENKGKLLRFLNGKRLGILRNDYIFTTFKLKSKHFFRIYNGWALNKILLKALRDVGVEIIEVIARDEKKVYKTNINNFFLHGIEYKNTKNEKDEQIILSLGYWKVFEM